MPRSLPAVLSRLCAFLAVALAVPAAAGAQTHATTVWNQLDALYKQVNGEGYSSRNYIIGRLKDDENETWTVTLYAGNSYRITGVCDGDCKDIDLALLDGNRNELTSDMLADDVPILDFTPKTTGNYTIKVMMPTCNQDPCYFGLGIFFK